MKNFWENIYNHEKNAEYDGWLDSFLPDLSKGKVLDLGCGNGAVSNFLMRQSVDVLACDFSEEALKNCTLLNPKIKTQKVDLREGLSFTDKSFSSVIAELSLHYFSSALTEQILREIWRILDDEGLLFVRVNSTKDVHFGAGQGEEIEQNFYSKNGNTKRFFDEEMIQHFFLTENWEKVFVSEQTKIRYENEKTFWEIVLRKRDDKK
ncbi:class I SAM-dependent methyltransferase [Lactococcus allomyrinae]|uniref:Class I SAM-dependent methyltransferase n=1 Tax=Lactococcus allomyrinae TaxID=2419773 RepID=A0A387BC09_9LACT|nr:class I SAM-dependent methyltransferase [Lactococcus allomyrinae]AYG01395.1 class I SAM-dependent methyltransferase [Lactococcus allomyrinae]